MLSGRFRARWSESAPCEAQRTKKEPERKLQEPNRPEEVEWVRERGSDPCISPNPRVVDMCYEIVEEIIDTASSIPPARISAGEREGGGGAGGGMWRKSCSSVGEGAWEQLHPSAEGLKSLSMPLPYPGDNKTLGSGGGGDLEIPFQNLSDPVQRVLSMLPITPATITPLETPMLDLEKVDDNTVDIKITTKFRAHFSTSSIQDAMRLPTSHRAQVEVLEYDVGDTESRLSGASVTAGDLPPRHIYARSEAEAVTPDKSGTPVRPELRRVSFMDASTTAQASSSSSFSSSAIPARPSSSAASLFHKLSRHRRVRSEGGGGVPDQVANPAPPAGALSPLKSSPSKLIAAMAEVDLTGESSPRSAPAPVPPLQLHGLGCEKGCGYCAAASCVCGSLVRGQFGSGSQVNDRVSWEKETSTTAATLWSPAKPSRTERIEDQGGGGGGERSSLGVGVAREDLEGEDTGGWREAWDRLRQQEGEEVPEICSPRAGPGREGNEGSAKEGGSEEQGSSGLGSQMEGSSGSDLMLLERQNSTVSWEVDPCEITYGSRLAVGGFAEVFKAHWQGTTVAVKKLLESDAHTVDRLRTEVKVLARLRHPNLILFMGYHSSPPIIVSEYMRKGSLHVYLRTKKEALDVPRQKAVLLSVARGMNYLHTRTPPILHLDLKSPNILIDDKWRVKIADFGLSKMRQRTMVSASSGGGGTPEWMAPEVLRSERYDERADVYSFGVVLWETLTGRSPWDHLNNPLQVVYAVGVEKKSLPTPEKGDPILLQLLRDCCAHDPHDRPLFNEIVKRLEAWDRP